MNRRLAPEADRPFFADPTRRTAVGVPSLRDRDETALALVVTAGNDPAERPYESLGFGEAVRREA